MTEPTTAPCYDRGCLHYDHEEPPCVGHMPSICCARLSAAIGSAAVADYRDATLATPTDRERKLEEALQLMQQAVRAEAQAIAWAEHSLERNEAVADLFRLLPDSMFPESFAALMERVVAIETIAAASALTARIGGSDHNAEFRALAAKFDGHRCRTGEHR